MEKRTLQAVSVAGCRPDPGNPRKQFDEADLENLADSLKGRQIEPIQVTKDLIIIDGERRWRAAQLAGLETLLAVVTDRALTSEELTVVRLTTFLHKKDLNAIEKWQAFDELHRLHGGTYKQLSELLHVDASGVTRILAPSRVIAPVREAFIAGQLTASDVYEISQAETEAQQLDRLNALLTGTKRADLARHRGRQKSTTSAVKATRFLCPLPAGPKVVVTGPAMTLDNLIDILATTLEAARKAIKEGIDIKTLQSVMKDKAKSPRSSVG
ncbi:ParB/RepB/Spo0J family partition protein [Fimbriiglobus ruber]|uniref:Chromosome (Plasmid) partitioning protein ParB / Stage 0 sporulation protein J n=1 Tax=Fimbriiglobus ruber TaxID=1908690 RepID=A0A225DEW1_9BACT|nr:ParB/RepB/Spo0J family partition protein [Fimbriiglobus ruber]OWK34925.1 Chromosome (plasmid) partitioning protein ParB / Stage 0 sporulation protein J [Fimbriiglobus ruber]